jgi:cytochrome c
MMFRFQPHYLLLTVFSLLICSFIVKKGNADKPKVLVFSKTSGWHHASIPAGIAAIQKLGGENGYNVDTTTNGARFSDDQLKQYQAVIFLNTTGNVLNGEQQAAFERYIQAGGGYAGVHAAADTEYDWPWYGKLAGAYFESHPNEEGTAIIDITDKNHPATAGLPDQWKRADEWYNYKSIYSDIKVLATLDESSYAGGTNGSNHPIAWYHEYDGGRAFYTGCGHREESYSDTVFLKHLQGGIQYAMGSGQKLDYSKAYAKVTPDQNRFVKTILTADINSPMELAVADDGRVFFTQLFGEFSVFNTKTNKVKLIHKFPITNIGGTGLIGLTLDPNFNANHHLYLYYAPGGQTENPLYFQLSRFTLNADELDLDSEKVLLKVPVQKVSGSHHGGSLAWDAKGNLFLSTGDAVSPFPSNGYAPLDERFNEESNGDSQATAANTNDLRGKILRIHPEPDGSAGAAPYTIPEGNLFPKGMDKTLPEIYIMGLRNPYRITVNKRSSVLYWGEVGPDAGNDAERGPRGYDEFNQAKKPGNHGWPYFIGNSYPYSKWDFTTSTAGPLFDPKAPVNNSPFNTGLKELPPVTAPMLWYPYASSKEFPELGVGGRCAIGGDIYYYNKDSNSPGKFPDYYDGAYFIADWMRNWIMDVRFDENENYVRTEPFMASSGDFRRPIDMAFGSDGILYVLEYGSVYGLANKDARLVKITYNRGNRAPIAKATIIDSAVVARVNKRAYLTSDRKNIPAIKKISGAAPLQVSFSGKGSADLDDDDAISYQWSFDGKTPGARTVEAKYTYTKPGTYKAILKVSDKGGLVGRDTLIIQVGNTSPAVSIAGPDNKSFYWKNKPFHYVIKVSDKEDGKIDPARVKAFYVYNSTPADITAADISKPSFGEVNYPGKALIAESDCKACHQTNAKAVGPSFVAVAERYKKDPDATDKLAKKIIEGGGGNWGTAFVMSAHPQISNANAREIVKYIFSLTDQKKSSIVNIPLQGTLDLKYNENEPRGEYTIVAAYTDKGGKIIGPLKSTDIVTLRPAEMNAAFADGFEGISRFRDNLSGGGDNAYLFLKNIDLTGISKIIFKYDSGTDAEIQVRLDSKAGPVIGNVPYSKTKEALVTVPITTPVTGRHDVYFYAVKRTKPNNSIIHISQIAFE